MRIMASKDNSSLQTDTLSTTLRTAFNAFKISLCDTFGYQILYNLLLLVVVLPILTVIFYFLVSTTGFPAMVNFDIASFLFSVRGIVTVLLFLFIIFSIYAFEKFGLLFITSSYQSGKRMSPFSALRQPLKQLPKEVLVVAKKIAYFVAVIALLLISNLLIKNYVSNAWISIPLLLLVMLLCIVLFYFLFIKWIFVEYLVVLEGKKISDAFSYKHPQSIVKHVAKTVIIWHLMIVLCLALLMLLCWSVSWLVLALVMNNMQLLVLVFSFLVALWTIILILYSLAITSFDSTLITELYFANREPTVIEDPPLKPEAVREKEAPAPLRRCLLVILILCIIVVSVGTTLLIPVVQKDIASIDKPIYVTAHRGSSIRAPENTISAVKAAIEDQADYAEIDVQETKDGVVVVLHDSNLKRVGGVDKNVWEMNYSELQHIDVGSWFSPEFAGERVPTLEEVIDIAKGRIKLNIELKPHGHEKNLVGSTVKLVEDKNVEDQVVITSNDYTALKEVRKLNPNLTIGMIIAAYIGDYSQLDIDFYSVYPEWVITKRFIWDAQDDNREVHIWTFSPEADVSRYVDLGVDNIIHDDPVKVRELLVEKQNRSKIEKIITKFFTFINWNFFDLLPW
jgi:glycerophosphoryl diester phosphodiesterase